MIRKLLTTVFALALVTVAAAAVFALLPCSAGAYVWDDPGTTCSSGGTCHGATFAGGAGAPLHDLHTPMTPDCNACHSDGGGSPIEISNSDNGDKPSCTGCHIAEGLRQHHRNAGAATCDGAVCHANPETSSPENTPPPYYGTVTAPNMDNPCNPSGQQNRDENWDGNTIGLDNDGDLLVDGNDPDCQAPAPTPAVPDVKANDQDGPLTVARGDMVAIDVGLVCNDDKGTRFDYVAVVLTPFGFYHYDLASKSWVPGLAVTVTAPCVDVARTLLNMKLPKGVYTFFWALDKTPDGVVTPAGANRDQVKVTVQ